MNPSTEQPKTTKTHGRYSIMSIMVVTAVFAASAASMGHLYRAAQGEANEVGHFAVITAMLPMVMLVGASWFFKIFGRFIK
jgi:hypothetical protein